MLLFSPNFLYDLNFFFSNISLGHIFPSKNSFSWILQILIGCIYIIFLFCVFLNICYDFFDPWIIHNYVVKLPKYGLLVIFFKTGLNLVVLFQKAGQKILYSQLFLTVTMCDEEYIFLNYWLWDSTCVH